jgi:hypothetical protein
MDVLHMGHQAMVAAASPESRMKPVTLETKLAAAEIELACLKLTLAQVEEDRDELRQNRDKPRQERDDWRREAKTLWAEKLIAAKLRESDAQRLASPERRPWWRRLASKTTSGEGAV